MGNGRGRHERSIAGRRAGPDVRRPNRNFALDPKAECIKGGPEIGRCASFGDLSLEDLLFVPAQDSPLAKPLVIASNATSGSATVFVLDGTGG